MIEIFAHSAGMREAVRLAERVAATDSNVLVTGESGVGRDVVAFFIHSRSARRVHPFVKIDCATRPGELLEAELFGLVMNEAPLPAPPYLSRGVLKLPIRARWCLMK